MLSMHEIQKDPMMELFLDECYDLITQYETYLSMADEKQGYDIDLINEIFRITHTLKADATMMLFECVAVPTRAFERLLYFYRDENSCQVDFFVFSHMILDLIEYLKGEMAAIISGSAVPTDGDYLKDIYLKYREKLAGELPGITCEKVEELAKSEINVEPMRYYIGGIQETATKQTRVDKTSVRNDELPVEKKQEFCQASEKDNVQETSQNEVFERSSEESEAECRAARRNSISGDEMDRLLEILSALNRLETRMTQYFLKDGGEGLQYMKEFQEVNLSLWDWIASTWMVPVKRISVKLRRIVDEMNKRLSKSVKLQIFSDELPAEKSWIDKLSTILVHLIRNSIDHGIESCEYRLSQGKNPDGHLSVIYRCSDDFCYFEAEVADDGRGIDMERLRQVAIERRLMEETADIPDAELLQFMFQPGVTTNRSEGVYSGRGVGMDVVWHIVSDLGGTVKVINKAGEGMSVTVRIPFSRTMMDKEEAEDEDIDSRR